MSGTNVEGPVMEHFMYGEVGDLQAVFNALDLALEPIEALANRLTEEEHGRKVQNEALGLLLMCGYLRRLVTHGHRMAPTRKRNAAPKKK